MEAVNNNIYEQIYNATEDDGSLVKADIVICALMQRSLFIAGFDSNKQLQTIHYTGYNNDKIVWDLNFFEPRFAAEQLLSVKDKVKAVFICTDKNMVIPEELYEEKAAKKWLGQIHHIEPSDIITAHPVADDKAQYVLATPVYITELIKINFKKASVLPLPLYHFHNSTKQSLYLQCCISGDQVCATLHNYSQLLWHKVFPYTCAEDIAYEVKQLCMENNISPSKLTIVCNAVSPTAYDTMNELSQYYPGIKAGDGSIIDGRWVPAISLAKQLLACV